MANVEACEKMKEEGGLHKGEQTVLLKNLARHSSDPLFADEDIWGREMEGWNFRSIFTGDQAREFNNVTVTVAHSSLLHSQDGMSRQMGKYWSMKNEDKICVSGSNSDTMSEKIYDFVIYILWSIWKVIKFL